MRHTFYILCMTTLGLTACSEKPLLTLEEKAKFTIELFADLPACKVFGERLQPPVVDEKVVEQTYLAAKQAHCLKPDV